MADALLECHLSWHDGSSVASPRGNALALAAPSLRDNAPE